MIAACRTPFLPLGGDKTATCQAWQRKKRGKGLVLSAEHRNFAPNRVLSCANQTIQFINTMYLDSAKKSEIFGQYGKSNTDTGSAESQVALFSYRISHLTEHMRANRKDHTTERALVKLVGKRRALLNYLKDRDIERYRAIVKALGLRK